MFKILFLLLQFFTYSASKCVKTSPTTVSGTHAPTGSICSGDLIFEDNFNDLDLKKWSHESTLGGGGNWEFQWYTNSRYNSYVEDGILFLKPTLTADEHGEEFLWSGHLDLNGGAPADKCTNPAWYGCIRDGTKTNYLNPVKSPRIRTVHSFSFKYGKLEVRAKLPAGDWLWPAIWMLPRWNQYSSWPVSGEIDIMESRGNRNYTNSSGDHIGTQLVGSTLHWGPTWKINRYMLTHTEKLNPLGYDTDFHNYQLLWDENSLQFSIDDEVLAKFEPPAGGFWEWGNLNSSGFDNPWKRSKSKLAPFDQEFYIIINLACGGLGGYFPDDGTNAGGKPWANTSPTASTDFWKGKKQWLPTWDLKNDTAALKIDYVRVWAL